MNIRHVTAACGWILAALLTAAESPARISVKLEEVLTIGGPDEDLLFLWTAVAVDRNDDIFLIDTLDYSVKKFDSSGRLLKKSGRKGQGPGEFDKAVGVAVAGDSVYAWDLNVKALQVYDRNLVYQKSLPLPGTVDGLARLPDGTLAAVIRTSAGSVKILVLSPEGRIVKEIVFSGSEAPALTDCVSFVVGPAGEYYLGYLFRDLVEKRDGRGSRIWAAAPWGAKADPAKEISGFKVPTETFVLSVARDCRGRIYALGGKKAKHQARDVAVFEPDGSPAPGFVLPEPTHTLYFDHRDFLYVAADGGVTMKKYRLVRE